MADNIPAELLAVGALEPTVVGSDDSTLMDELIAKMAET